MANEAKLIFELRDQAGPTQGPTGTLPPRNLAPPPSSQPVEYRPPVPSSPSSPEVPTSIPSVRPSEILDRSREVNEQGQEAAKELTDAAKALQESGTTLKAATERMQRLLESAPAKAPVTPTAPDERETYETGPRMPAEPTEPSQTRPLSEVLAGRRTLADEQREITERAERINQEAQEIRERLAREKAERDAKYEADKAAREARILAREAGENVPIPGREPPAPPSVPPPAPPTGGVPGGPISPIPGGAVPAEAIGAGSAATAAGLAVWAGALIAEAQFLRAGYERSVQRANELAAYSPELAGSMARREIVGIRRDMEAARRFGPQLSRIEDNKTVIGDVLERFKDDIMAVVNPFTELVTGALANALEDADGIAKYIRPFVEGEAKKNTRIFRWLLNADARERARDQRDQGSVWKLLGVEYPERLTIPGWDMDDDGVTVGQQKGDLVIP